MGSSGRVGRAHVGVRFPGRSVSTTVEGCVGTGDAVALASGRAPQAATAVTLEVAKTRATVELCRAILVLSAHGADVRACHASV